MTYRKVELTDMQLSHAVVAIQSYMEDLLRKANHDPEGGEHEDYLVAQSVLAALKAAKHEPN
ncbi:hypothetical protein PY254_13745 [Rhodanobacter sp. AS-Z3]|uniref:hypothetical protein n=1 Tax=Rhodanobacter sp. AS-Z3 TaxID=3031330 RepID=UPI0024786D09|nr:hypothetical protein [Rhodanobacter sp. AS-Z3]WEN14292.1 hypothetical protein PY254_13745 [Rhodanobacter sp. AS-Z3]